MKSYRPNLNIFTLDDLDGIILGTSDSLDLGCLEVSTYWTKYYKVYGLLILFWLGYIDTLELGKNKGSKLGFPNGEILGKKLGALDWMELGSFNDTELEQL